MSFFKLGEKPREQYRLPQGSFIHADQWMDYLSPEQYCWWLKFHSWVNRKPNRFADNHVPRTLENVFKELGVSKTTFYRKIKVLWESGLIEIVEFDLDERKSQKPKNIIVYEYPFNNAEFEYKPLEKRRDWTKDYVSHSKLSGLKGGLMRKKYTRLKYRTKFETVEIPVDNSDGFNSETVEQIVDNHRTKFETVGETVDNHRFNSETVTVSNLKPNKDTNNIKNIIKEREYLLNLSLTNITVEELKNLLIGFTFSEGECDKVVELILQHKLFDISKQEIIKQAQYMLNRTGIRSRPIYFVKGVETNLGRIYPEKRKEQDGQFQAKLPIYNWLEE